MKLSRRRFLTISAAFAATPGVVSAQSWQGHAFGAEVSLTIRGPRGEAEAALSGARDLIFEIERLFSLYDPTSQLVRLNRLKILDQPDPRFLALMQKAGRAHSITGGLFDPTVQSLWKALAVGDVAEEASQSVDWTRVRFDGSGIALDPDQSLTFNGIAQGFATDLVTEALAVRGASDMLVNIGEFRGTGGPWRLGLSDPKHGHMGTRTITEGAVATSSPAATLIGTESHIMHPIARPKWSTVSVVADSATMADAVSTALVLADLSLIQNLVGQAGIRQITMVDFDGNLTTL